MYLFTMMSLSATAAKLLHQLNLTILACTSTGKEEKKKHFSFTISLQRTGSSEWNGYVSCMAGSKSTFGQRLSTSPPQNYR